MKEEKKQKVKIVIDATDGILGRVASYAAKQALRGKEVAIVNCKHAVLTGRKRSIIEEYQEARLRGGSSMKGPFFPKQPQKIMKRTIRGMLPYKKERGDAAMKSIMCYDALPAEYEKSEKITLVKPLKVKSYKLHELSKEI
ncbi:MAG: 50S ribosomal protein L13 [Nanoarchaeota archaeon]|nr:50S ribosomal protein L13 [Nanoarchaeota archaeon]